MVITLRNMIWLMGIATGKVKMGRDALGSIKVFSHILCANEILRYSIYKWSVL